MVEALKKRSEAETATLTAAAAAAAAAAALFKTTKASSTEHTATVRAPLSGIRSFDVVLVVACDVAGWLVGGWFALSCVGGLFVQRWLARWSVGSFVDGSLLHASGSPRRSKTLPDTFAFGTPAPTEKISYRILPSVFAEHEQVGLRRNSDRKAILLK